MATFNCSRLAAALAAISVFASISYRGAFAQAPHELKGHRAAIASLSFSADGKLLASASRDGVIILWDLETREVRRTFTPARDGKFLPNRVAFLPDGKSLVVAGAEEVQLWDLKTGDAQESVDARLSENSSLAVSSNGKFIAWDEGALVGVKLWQPRFDKLEILKSDANGLGGFIGFSPNGAKLLTTHEPNAFVLWDVDQRKELLSKTGRPEAGLAIRASFSPSGKSIAQPRGFNSKKQSSIIVWDAATGETTAELATDSSLLISHVAYLSTENALVSAAASTALSVWNIETGKVAVTLGSEPEVQLDSLARYSGVAALEVSPDGNLAATCSTDSADAVVRLWDVSKFQLTVEKKPPPVAASSDRPEFRTWTSADGQFTTDAILVKINEDSVTVLTREGKAVTVRLDRLSEADRAYVKQRPKSETD